MRAVPFTLGSSLLLIGILLAGVRTAAACGSGKLIFEDKFETLDPAWGLSQSDPTRSNGPGGLVYKFDPGNNTTLLNQTGFYDNYEVCGVFTTDVPANSDTYVAVDFWANDTNNAYEADIYPAYGTYGVYRYQNGKPLKPISPTGSDAVNKGTASVNNEISVSVNGNKATIAINGKKVSEMTGQPPEGGSVFGLALGTAKSDSGPSSFTVKSIQLRELENAHS
jgi:hypothetical protein